MKTPEDEAFDDLAKRQGAWGGGFPAKRKMTMDKIHAEFYEKYVRYRTAFPKEYKAPQVQEDRIKYGTSWEKDGERIDPMSVYKEPEQEPVAWVNTGELQGLTLGHYSHVEIYTDESAGRTPLYTAPPQPAQEPHEYDWSMLEAAKESLREHMARIKELEAALAQPPLPVQEPVACVGPWDGPTLTLLPRSIHQTFEHNQPLYAAPPQREWVGLTDEEMQACWDAHMGVEDYSRIVHQAIEAKLKEKNNGT